MPALSLPLTRKQQRANTLSSSHQLGQGGICPLNLVYPPDHHHMIIAAQIHRSPSQYHLPQPRTCLSSHAQPLTPCPPQSGACGGGTGRSHWSYASNHYFPGPDPCSVACMIPARMWEGREGRGADRVHPPWDCPLRRLLSALESLTDQEGRARREGAPASWKGSERPALSCERPAFLLPSSSRLPFPAASGKCPHQVTLPVFQILE